MKTQTPHTRPRSDEGSLPLAMVVTVFCVVLSMLALSSLVLQATRSQAADAKVTSQLANDSGVAVAGQKMAAATAGLCNVPYSAPDTFEPAPGDSKVGFRWWVDKTDIADGKVKAIVETQSGNPRATAATTSSIGYTWDAAANRWQITSRKGEEVFPYPATGNFFRVTTPARFTSTPDNRGLGLTLNAEPNGSDSPALNDAILSDGRYVWLAGEFSSASGAEGTASTSSIVKLDTSNGEVVEGFTVALGDPTNDYVSSMIFVGDDIVIGGKFTSINGAARNHLAKINKDTGALISGFNDGQRLGVQYGPTQRVMTLAYDDSRDLIVAGGTFVGWVTPLANGTVHRFAAVDPTTGVQVANGIQGDPDFTEPVEHLAVVGDGTVVAGGRLYASGNPLHRALVSVAADGSVSDTGMDVTRGGNVGLLRDLAVDPAHPDQLVAGFGYSGGGTTPEMVRMFRVSDGATLWTTPTGHDVHTVAWIDGLVYGNVHNGTGFGDATTRLFALNDDTGAQDPSFKPVFPAWDGSDYSNYWGAFKIVASKQGLAAFGAFTSVSGESVSNFAWFPNKGGC